MQRVELLLVLRFLCQQPVHQRDHFHHTGLQCALWNLVQLPLNVAQHTTGVALETTQRLAHPLELAGMGIASDLTGKARGQTVVVLSQTDPGLAGQPDELAPVAP